MLDWRKSGEKSVYVAGPMRGYDNFNFQKFEDVAQTLSEMGYHVVSPHQFDIDERRVVVNSVQRADGTRIFLEVGLAPDFDIEQTLCDDFLLLLGVDGIVMLPGWDASDGACKERTVAEWAGKKIGFWENETVRWS